MAKQEIRKISTTGPGSTYYITLPREMIKKLKWKKGEKKVISLDGKNITIRDWKRGDG